VPVDEEACRTGHEGADSDLGAPGQADDVGSSGSPLFTLTLNALTFIAPLLSPAE